MPDAPDTAAAAVSANRRAWDAAARLHLKGDDWAEQVAEFAMPGYLTFDPVLTGLLDREPLVGNRWCRSAATMGARR
jgi:hypothetical protein